MVKSERVFTQGAIAFDVYRFGGEHNFPPLALFLEHSRLYAFLNFLDIHRAALPDEWMQYVMP